MAHIWRDEGIREKTRFKDILNGRPFICPLPLGFTPGLKKTTLSLFDRLFLSFLNPKDWSRAVAAPSWVSESLGTLLLLPEKEWKDTFERECLPRLSMEVEPVKTEAPKTDPRRLEVLFKAYNRRQALESIVKTFPLYERHKEAARALAEKALEQKSLMLNSKKKIPLPVLKTYRDLVGQHPDPQIGRANIKHLGTRLNEIGYLHDRSGNWLLYLRKECRLQRLDHVQREHLSDFKYWRRSHRIGGMGNKTQSVCQPMMEKDHGYLRRVFDMAKSQGLVEQNPYEGLKLNYSLPVEENNVVLKPHSYIRTEEHEGSQNGRRRGKGGKPIPLSVLLTLLKTVALKIESMPENTRLKRRRKQQWRTNYLTLVFLVASGCRPVETNQISVSTAHLHVDGTKTDNANRLVPLTPTLRKAILDPDFADNRNSVEVANRIAGWLRRRKFKIGSYGFRHFNATLLYLLYDLPPERISEQLGHETKEFSLSHYVRMSVLLADLLDLDELREFWFWFNNAILDTKAEDFPVLTEDKHIRMPASWNEQKKHIRFPRRMG